MAMAADTGVPGRNYTKVKEIGKGSYGKAILVQDRDAKNYVMKIIDMTRMDGKQRKDAINEVKVLSSLKHPYIISYRESFTEGKSLAIVMDYADGGDLHQRIQLTRRAGKCLPEEKVLRWFTEATLALKYLHDRHILHRDLKTSNLFLTSQDRLRVGDFGISKVLESTVAFARTTIGTPYYLSPEICMERPYSFSSDIWALGCVLYELAALRVPFDAQSLQALVQKITRGPAPTLPSTYSAELNQLGRDLLHRDQSQRPAAPEILQRPFIQQEIRHMLREEQAKVSGKSDPNSACPTITPLKPCNKAPSLVSEECGDNSMGLMPLSARKPQPLVTGLPGMPPKAIGVDDRPPNVPSSAAFRRGCR
jgi:NIMA (never in mitosis gene a)-related kinase